MSAEPLAELLDRDRRALLDLSGRNRLLNSSIHGSRTSYLRIRDELSDEVFRQLVREQGRMSFTALEEVDRNEVDRSEVDDGEAPGEGGEPGDPEDNDEDWEPVPPDSATDPEDGDAPLPEHYTDDRLQTGLTREKLDKRLLKSYYEARTLEEETGVNTLFLVFGFLEYYEDDSAEKPRLAPLITAPVELVRRDVKARIRIGGRDEPIETNLSLQLLLSQAHGIGLPEIPAGEDWLPSEYFAAVEHAIQSEPRWSVRRDEIVLGFYSFAKFLMYRDLDPEDWPEGYELGDHPLLTPLLSGGFRGDCSGPWSGNRQLDRVYPPSSLLHVLDADSSQTIAIEKVKAGHNLVIQGPPGTGKSQTITNLIAAAVAEGRTVLFVAEKMAALEVVKRRMDQVGLGHLCLELHSHKANKKEFLRVLRESLAAQPPDDQATAAELRDLDRCAEALNAHAELMHLRHEPGGLTAYRAIGKLAALHRQGRSIPDIGLPGMLAWSEADYAHRLGLCAHAGEVLRPHPPPAEHPWVGVTNLRMLPSDRERMRPEIEALQQEIAALSTEVAGLRQRLQAEEPVTLADARRLILVADCLSKVPAGDLAALGDPVWRERGEELLELLLQGQRFAGHRAAALQAFGEDCLDWDPRGIHGTWLRHGESWLRWLNGGYRAAKRELRARSKGRLPRAFDVTVAALENLVAAHRCRDKIQAGSEVGAAAFGSLWRGPDSGWDALGDLHGFVEETEAQLGDREFLPVLSRCAEPAALGPAAAGVQDRLAAVGQRLARIRDTLELHLLPCLGADDPDGIRFDRLRSRVGTWLDGFDRLPEWSQIHRALEDLRGAQLGPLADRLFDGCLAPDDLHWSFEGIYHEGWIRRIYERHPELHGFEGERHERDLRRFRDLDQRRIVTAAASIADHHASTRPRGDLGEMGILRHEMRKKTRHMPIRRLLQEAGAAIQGLKPVFMMSPLSISRFIAPGQLDFDLLLIDEASQVEPVDAYGALLRCRQMAVVGDEKQLPPTSFFHRMGLEEEPADFDDDEDAVQPQLGRDLESILSICLARNVPAQMLEWHYRSQHESLIAASNRYFYDNGLLVVPSAVRSSERLGLRFHHLPDAIYERGKQANNPVEARAVAEAAIEHARCYPGETLGIGAFSVSQRDAILDALELLWRDNPDVADFFRPSAAEPFFVKNLENIQGDERDVIYISVGYGKDRDGKLYMSFGPLSVEGGDRRMNVLMSRARRRCEVWSSIQAADIDLSRGRSQGVKVLKAFLHYAETGDLDIPEVTGHAADSEFEVQVAESLRALGHDVEHQVGVAGFHVDLAVRDPEQAGRFVLGIECDGASYHSSRSARDRDRIRQDILERRGWCIHRIWSTDWYQDPRRELQKLESALQEAQAGASLRYEALLAAPAPIEVQEPADSGDVDDDGDDGDGEDTVAELPEARPMVVEIYVEAEVDVPPDAPPLHEWERSRLAPAVQAIVKVEGPIHGSEVARRLSHLCGNRRTGNRIQGVVTAALQQLIDRGDLVAEEGFYSVPGQVHRLRDRSAVHSSNLKKPDFIAMPELAAGIAQVLEACARAKRDQLPVIISRALGMRSTSSRMRDRVDEAVGGMLERGQLEEKNGSVRLP